MRISCVIFLLIIISVYDIKPLLRSQRIFSASFELLAIGLSEDLIGRNCLMNTGSLFYAEAPGIIFYVLRRLKNETCHLAVDI